MKLFTMELIDSSHSLEIDVYKRLWEGLHLLAQCYFPYALDKYAVTEELMQVMQLSIPLATIITWMKVDTGDILSLKR